MARNDPQININVPEELKKALEEISQGNKRSVTAEVVSRLQASLDAEKTMAMAETGDPTAMILAAIDTVRTGCKVIEQSLLQLNVETGNVQIEDEAGEYEFSTEDLALMQQLKSMTPEARKALTTLLSTKK